MAWNEWEQLKAKPPVGGKAAGGPGDLIAHQDDLGAVGHEAYVLHDALLKRADIAGAGLNGSGACTSAQAAAALKSHHFTMGTALETTVSLWTSQLRALLQACAHISNHLDHTKASHAADDAKIKTRIRGISTPEVPVSRLTEYFK
ncbi:hypothetical protein ACH4SP_31430 [Streptomyces sp. NPDC021093]|uniref:hypothetical protein n=1 Tax=Streptomyces sp. NPDC021093 TaxID=3365112 RepID=UPI00379927D2